MTRAVFLAFLGCSALFAQESDALVSEGTPATRLSDAIAMEKINSRLGGPFPPPTRTKLATLNDMVRHSNEMYGYMCVYL